jgi:acetyl-CoA carboxylase biotin carboxyl carrier protein
MNLDDIKEVLELVREHDLAEFELERDGLKIRIKKGPSGQYVVHPVAPVALPAGVHAPSAVPTAPSGALPVAQVDAGEVNLAVVKSPIVGTFYRAPEPGAAPFVDVGGAVRQGQVLCIIEAMKLMNEIESEYAGEVAKIYVENGQPVQYGERLFAIKVS